MFMTTQNSLAVMCIILMYTHTTYTSTYPPWTTVLPALNVCVMKVTFQKFKFPKKEKITKSKKNMIQNLFSKSRRIHNILKKEKRRRKNHIKRDYLEYMYWQIKLFSNKFLWISINKLKEILIRHLQWNVLVSLRSRIAWLA